MSTTRDNPSSSQPMTKLEYYSALYDLNKQLVEQKKMCEQVMQRMSDAKKLGNKALADLMEMQIQLKANLDQQASPSPKTLSQFNHSSPVLLKAQPQPQQQNFSAATGTPSQIASTTYSARR